MYNTKERLIINGYITLYYKSSTPTAGIRLNDSYYEFYYTSEHNRIPNEEIESLKPLLEKIFPIEKEITVSVREVEFENARYSFDSTNNEIFIYDKKIKFIKCENVIDFLEQIKKIPQLDMTLYYRGQSLSHLWVPSLYRHEEWIENESKIITRVLSRHVDEFSDCDTAIEKAIKLKHYNIPSRLLDIVASPLTALYFACESALYEDEDAVVAVIFSQADREKYTLSSDTVTMLSNISRVSSEKRNDENLFKGELGYLCQKENKTDLYWDDIKIEDLDQCIVVHPELNNTRIIQQQGLFILCGYSYRTDNTLPADYFDFFKSAEGERLYFRFPKDAPKEIIKELDNYGINKSSMYFDLEKTIEYEKNKVLKH